MEKLFQLSRVKLFYKKEILHDNEILFSLARRKSFCKKVFLLDRKPISTG